MCHTGAVPCVQCNKMPPRTGRRPCGTEQASQDGNPAGFVPLKTTETTTTPSRWRLFAVRAGIILLGIASMRSIFRGKVLGISARNGYNCSHMARAVVSLLLMTLLTNAFAALPAAFTPPTTTPSIITAVSGILMDRQTGEVLWQHNPDLPLPMASTTKIMTAMVILDHGADKLGEKVRVSHYAASTGGSSTFAEGDVATLENLLRGALICSSNEATVAAAEFLAGNEQTFVGWMNDKAKTLGCKHTHFVNPHGLYKGAQGQYHYSSARDLALIARAALQDYPLIRQIVAMPRAPISTETRNETKDNHDKIVQQEVPGVPGAIVDGVKTGYVRMAGKCLVSSASLKGWQLIAVVLNSENTYGDNLALLSYGFRHFTWKTFASDEQAGMSLPVKFGEPGEVSIGVKGAFGAPTPLPAPGEPPVDDRLVFQGPPLRAPVRAGQEVGTLTLTRNGKPLLTAPAIVMQGSVVAWWIRLLCVLGYCALGLTLILIVGILYGTRAKAARRRRRHVAATRRGTNPGGSSLG